MLFDYQSQTYAFNHVNENDFSCGKAYHLSQKHYFDFSEALTGTPLVYGLGFASDIKNASLEARRFLIKFPVSARPARVGVKAAEADKTTRQRTVTLSHPRQHCW
jgi:hypothetical protein